MNTYACDPFYVYSKQLARLIKPNMNPSVLPPSKCLFPNSDPTPTPSIFSSHSLSLSLQSSSPSPLTLPRTSFMILHVRARADSIAISIQRERPPPRPPHVSIPPIIRGRRTARTDAQLPKSRATERQVCSSIHRALFVFLIIAESHTISLTTTVAPNVSPSFVH